MKINYGRNIIELEGARIIYRNFAGAPSKFNREGDRNFAVIVPSQDDCDELLEAGWNVKIKEPREGYEDDGPFMFLPVKVKFNNRGPGVYLECGEKVQQLDEETIQILDDIDISSVNLVIRPYDWEVNGKTGRTAYLQAIQVVQNIDPYGAKYYEEGKLGE